MISFPIAKINLGLNIVGKRSDGYHNLETVFYPIPIQDAIEINLMHKDFPSSVNCDIKITNATINGNDQDNLIVLAYNLLAKYYTLPRIHVHLFKGIPTQAGLGGGSSDCAYMLNMLNKMFELKISNKELLNYAKKLGADCPFFINSVPAYGEGIGEVLTPIDFSLKGFYITIIHPNIPISTKEAFSRIIPKATNKKCIDIIRQPVDTWQKELINDFEYSVFSLYPILSEIKQKLYNLGAIYVSMSGSGSSIYALSHSPIVNKDTYFKDMFTYCMLL